MRHFLSYQVVPTGGNSSLNVMGTLGNSNTSFSNLDVSRQINKQVNLPTSGQSGAHLASQGAESGSNSKNGNEFGLTFGKVNENGIYVKTLPESIAPLEKFTYFVENQKILSNKIFYVDA